MGIDRAETIARMRKSFRAGVSASRFISSEREAGRPTYRRSTMLGDWRTINELEVKEGLARFIRKDRYPTEKTLAAVEWELSKEYMYKVRVQSVIKAGEPITERFVNIMSDIPLTPAMIESEVEEQWAEWEKYAREKITDLIVLSAVRKTIT